MVMAQRSVSGNLVGEAFDYVFLPSYQQTLERLKRNASMHSSGEFATSVTTLGAWVADSWELFGDGRRIVTKAERDMVMATVFESSALCDGSGDGCISPEAAAKVASYCVQNAAGLPAFEKAVAFPGDFGLSEAQIRILEGVSAYYARLEELGRIERGHVLAALPDLMGDACVRRVRFSGALPFGPVDEAFLEALKGFSYDVEWAQGVDGIGPAPDGIDVRFAFPAGGYARPRLLMRIIDECLDGGTAVITAKDPARLFSELAPALLERGIPCAVQSRVPFPSTELGRALFSVYRVMTDPDAPKSLVSDFLFTSFSGLGKREACELDAAMRRDRCKDASRCLDEVRARCRMLDIFEELAQTPDADVLLGVIEDYIDEVPGYDEAYRAQQKAAAAVLRTMMGAARLAGASMARCMARLSSVSVESSACVGAAGAGDVRVIVSDQKRAAQREPGSCDAVIMCEMSSDAYPVQDAADSGSVLLGELGIGSGPDTLVRERCTFSALAALPRRLLVIERSLNDAAANPTYPCVTVQEFVDCYREDTAATDDIDNAYALPEHLRRGMFELGEEGLFENAAVSERPQDVIAEAPRPCAGQVSDSHRTMVVASRSSDGGDVAGLPVLSASQIESYLRCPYLWFAQRRLRLSALDEGFGPVQKGDFAHHALRDFYGRFTARTGLPRVSAESLEAAQAIMDEVLAEHVRNQYELEPLASNRLVAVTELESREVTQLCDAIRDHLAFDAEFLPGFHPAYHEFGIRKEDGVVYAGRLLAGSVDRVDVDGQGRAVIVDYKSSIGPEYALSQETDGIPLKVQTLIYAQAVRRILGLDVVGAVYVCYGRSHAVSGAFDARLEPGDFGGIDAEACGYMPQGAGSFADLLDGVERRIDEELGRMFSGDIAPDPSFDGACAWCPVTGCPERRS